MKRALTNALAAAATVALVAGVIVTAGSAPGRGFASDGHMDRMPGMTGGMHGPMHGGSEAGTNGTGTLVVMRDSQFQPTTLYVRVGETVVWRNDDPVSHTVTSDGGSELDSPLLDPGASWSHTFDTAGTFEYHCMPHSWRTDDGYAGMTARVVVRP